MVNNNNEGQHTSANEDASDTFEVNEVALGNQNDAVENANMANSEKQTAMFGWKLAGLVIIVVLTLIYTTVGRNPQADFKELAAQDAIASFDERLLSCNAVTSAEPTDAFAICLAAAEDGQALAKRRMIWAYSRANQYQDWQAVFNWLKAIQERDKPTQLLLYTILHIMGDEPAQKKEGEEGINQLVTRNYAPANILMASIYALKQNQLPPNNNTLWLLERAYQQSPNSIDPASLALIYANGFAGQQDIDKARALLIEAANVSYPISTNNIAWFLSTLDDNPFTSPSYALELALKVVENSENAGNHIYIDTLAAAYAANKNFALAVQTQEQAISLIGNVNINESIKEREIEAYTLRLKTYKEGKSLVETTLQVDKDIFFKRLKTSTVDYLFRNFFIRVNSPISESEVKKSNDSA